MNNQDLELKLNYITSIAISCIADSLDRELVSQELVDLCKSFIKDEALDNYLDTENEEVCNRFMECYNSVLSCIKEKTNA